MYDWKGRWIEPDDSEPQLRRRCTCGAFLTKEPGEKVTSTPLDWHVTYDEQGEITGYTVLTVQEQRDWVWTCKRCNKDYDASEMFT